jgi:N-acetylglucosaminyldiphosphoundecaprenol N-acetyl-beta-D-mannosaminyltransferase
VSTGSRTGPSVDVLGVGISAVDPATALGAIRDWIDRREQHYVCVTGVHGVMECQRDEELRRIHNRSGMTVPDGMPMVWASHRAGARTVARVYGPDLMRTTCAEGARRGWRMFLYGSTPEVLTTLTERLERDYPGLLVVGTISPPFRPLTEAERRTLADEIESTEPDIVWVGLSTPKQEREMAALRPLVQVPVLIGVGAAFDLVSGLTRQAPALLQRMGLEWAFRLAVEPRRLWRRYARNNPAFVWHIARRPPQLMSAPDGGERRAPASWWSCAPVNGAVARSGHCSSGCRPASPTPAWTSPPSSSRTAASPAT